MYFLLKMLFSRLPTEYNDAFVNSVGLVRDQAGEFAFIFCSETYHNHLTAEQD